MLIEKWRGVAREAVEGMFEGVKGRVDGMGGVRGMKRTRREILRGDGDGGGEDEGEDAGQEERNDEDEVRCSTNEAGRAAELMIGC